MPSNDTARSEASSKPAAWWLAFILLYVTLVLSIDTLATMHYKWPIRWGMFDWGPRTLITQAEALGLPASATGWMGTRAFQGFDVFKFLFWFVVPFALCLRGMDWGAYGVTRWKRRDLYFLFGLAVTGMLAMQIIPLIPELRNIYPDLSERSLDYKLAFALRQSIWVFSWLIGWEYLHRYFMLRPLSNRWPRVGWLLVPLAEGLYHLQKPGPEALGMVLFSVVLCLWTLRRRNILLPFLAHFIIEVELVLAILF